MFIEFMKLVEFFGGDKYYGESVIDVLQLYKMLLFIILIVMYYYLNKVVISEVYCNKSNG